MPRPSRAIIKLIPHTADIGIDVRARNLDDLFAAAAMGFTKILITNPSAIRHSIQRELWLDTTDLVDLMVRWLSELLYLFDTEQILFNRYIVHVDPGAVSLYAKLKGERYDPSRHRAGREVKAVTYHEATVEQTNDGMWHARVIFDI